MRIISTRHFWLLFHIHQTVWQGSLHLHRLPRITRHACILIPNEQMIAHSYVIKRMMFPRLLLTPPQRPHLFECLVPRHQLLLLRPSNRHTVARHEQEGLPTNHISEVLLNHLPNKLQFVASRVHRHHAKRLLHPNEVHQHLAIPHCPALPSPAPRPAGSAFAPRRWEEVHIHRLGVNSPRGDAVRPALARAGRELVSQRAAAVGVGGGVGRYHLFGRGDERRQRGHDGAELVTGAERQ